MYRIGITFIVDRLKNKISVIRIRSDKVRKVGEIGMYTQKKTEKMRGNLEGQNNATTCTRDNR